MEKGTLTFLRRYSILQKGECPLFRLVGGLLALLMASGFAGQTSPSDLSGLKTVPEKTDYRETSRYADVMAFLRTLEQRARTIHVTSFGVTNEKRDLPLVVVGAPSASPQAVRGTGKLRVYIQGNIHAGEVEGKESAQMLLRELALGQHGDWLQSMVLLVAPIYNADGNERIALDNRGPQYGPMGGQGQRPNAQGLDLNRDHMKLDSPEARAVVKVMNDYDPHVSIDLHTTNGSLHAYLLTYAPPLNPVTDPAITMLLRLEWLPRVTATIRAKYGWDYYYYGNLQGTNRVPARRRNDRGERSTIVHASTTTTSGCAIVSPCSAKRTHTRIFAIAFLPPAASSRPISTT